MNNDDFLFDSEEEENNNDTSDVSLDSEDETTNENVEDQETSWEEETTEYSEDTWNSEEVSEEQEEANEELDINSLLKELEDAKDTIDTIESDKDWDSSLEISQLKQSLNNMTNLIKKLSNEKADLTYKLAEVEAFGSDNTDPKMLLLWRNLTKANAWDDKAKTKAISVLKDMLYDLSWEDYEWNKREKDLDILTSIENYNNSSKPNLKSYKKEEDGLSM